MLERTPNEILPMPMPPMVTSTASCACCGHSFERGDRSIELCTGCHQAAAGHGAPGPVIPQTIGQRVVTVVGVLLVVGLVALRVWGAFGY